MKIVIFSPTSVRLFPNAIEERPLGGADNALLRLIGLLAWQGHEVTAAIPVDRIYLDGNITYIPFMDLFSRPTDCDVYIHYRKIYAVPPAVKAKKKIFYSQDTTDTPCFGGSFKDGYSRVFEQFNKVITLSNFHKQNLKEAFGIEEHKFEIIGNAANEQPEIKKRPLSFIYASTPFRGLVVLARMWKKIIEKYPEATLHVFSSMKIYDAELHDNLHFQPLYDKIRTMRGITHYGSRPQKEVLERMSSSFMLLYPNTFPETYCNVLMEARACRTPFITSRKGALMTTGQYAGYYVEGNPYTNKYQDDFLNMLFYIIKNPEHYKNYQENCYPIRTWLNYSNDWAELLKRL